MPCLEAAAFQTSEAFDARGYTWTGVRLNCWKNSTGSSFEAENCASKEFLSFGKINPMNCSVVVPVYRGEYTLNRW